MSIPASSQARQRRSPMMSSYLASGLSAIGASSGRTMTGWSTPTSLIEAASSASSSSSKTVRGCFVFGIIAVSGSSANVAPGTSTNPPSESFSKASSAETTSGWLPAFERSMVVAAEAVCSESKSSRESDASESGSESKPLPACEVSESAIRSASGYSS